MFLYLLIAVIVLLLVFLWKTYNGLISMRNNLHNAWSDIDVQLTRRHDLARIRWSQSKGYMAHERQTLAGRYRGPFCRNAERRRHCHARSGGDGFGKCRRKSVCEIGKLP